MNDLCLEDIDFDFLSRARHMHFSNCFMQPGIRNDLTVLFRKAKELGLTTSFDTQWDPEEKWNLPLEDLLPYVDIFLPNIKEFMFLTHSNSVDEGIKKLKDFANLIIIKNGSDGAMAWDGKKLIHQESFRNDNVVDCIGAGDSFNAGFIKDFLNNQPLIKCLETGALAGAINTTRAGGTDAFINIDTFRDIAREKFNYSF
jgi:sugar/nucleoside kinase (ribokinase family)